MGVPEPVLVREALHCCQGLNGRYVWWQASKDAKEEGFYVSPGAEVPPGTRRLVRQLTETGWLLREVARLTERLRSAGSPVHTALAAAASDEVSSFYRLLAILEEQVIDRDPRDEQGWEGRGGSWGDEGAGAGARGNGGGWGRGGAAGVPPKVPGLTLRRLAVWLGEPAVRLRTLARALSASDGSPAPEALDSLRSLAADGDPQTRRVASRLLAAGSRPYVERMLLWATRGELEPTRGALDAFFVVQGRAKAAAPGGASAGVGGARRVRRAAAGPAAPFETDLDAEAAGPSADALWREGYDLHPEARPRLLPRSLAERAALCGRTIAFLRDACGDDLDFSPEGEAADGEAGSAWALGDERGDGGPRAPGSAGAPAKGTLDALGSTMPSPRGSDPGELIPAGRAPDAPVGEPRPPAELLSELEAAVRRLAPRANARALQRVVVDGRLALHLGALRDYLLLSRGDFGTALLAATAGPEWDAPDNAAGLDAPFAARHDARAALEEAVRGSSAAQDDPSLLARLGARAGAGHSSLASLLGGGGGAGLAGLLGRGAGGEGAATPGASSPRDSLELMYGAGGAVDAVLSRPALATYTRLFRTLWLALRAEASTDRAWLALKRATAALARARARERRSGVEAEGLAEALEPALRAFGAARAEVGAGARALRAYLALGVVQPATRRGFAAILEAGSLDATIARHETMLTELQAGFFQLPSLTAAGTSSGESSADASRAAAAGDALRAALRAARRLAAPFEALADAAEASEREQAEYVARAEASEAAGTWTDEVLRGPAVDLAAVDAARAGLWRVRAEWSRAAAELARCLPAEAALALQGALGTDPAPLAA